MREKIYQVLWRSNYFENVQKNKDKFKFVLANQTYTTFAIAVIYTLGGFANTLSAIAFLCIAFIYSVPVGIALIVSIAVTLLVSFVTGRSILNGYEANNKAQEKDTAQIYETVDITEATRTNGLEEYFLSKNKKIHNEFMHLSEKVEGKSAFCEAVESSLHSLIYIIVAGILLLTTDVNGGKIVTILFITNLTLETSQRVQRQLQVIIKNIPAFENVVELMEIPLETGNEIEKIDTIAFENLSLEIDDRKIIHNLSRSIGKGENILIKGENGSGKSSLLKMILGLYKPTEGKILLNGTDLNEYDCKSFYKEICYISQDELMLNESVEDYLRYVTHSEMDDEHIKTLRAKVKLKNDIQKIEENGLTLSGGEKKKLFMLKCLMEQNASVVILDEIDAGLDDETKVILKELENNLKKDSNKILMKISHIDTDTTGFHQVIQL
jgi:ABC-type bacteriocin/lantibiotic exporter with double-glycine peptidase domain